MVFNPINPKILIIIIQTILVQRISGVNGLMNRGFCSFSES